MQQDVHQKGWNSKTYNTSDIIALSNKIILNVIPFKKPWTKIIWESMQEYLDYLCSFPWFEGLDEYALWCYKIWT